MDYPRIRFTPWSERVPVLNGFLEAYGHILLLVSFILAVCSVIAIILLAVSVKRLKAPFRSMAELYEKKGAERALEELLRGVDENRDFLRGHSAEIKAIIQRLDGCYSGTGMVKYNAFEDIGGMQSYSICLLTKERNGFILTNLVGRNSTRGYALEIAGGTPSRDLSDEEQEAFGYAMKSLGS
jgi:hypothetical protein